MSTTNPEVTPSPGAKCRLCGTDNRPLRKSHIVPEFLYRDLYNDKRHMMAIREPHGRHHAWRPLQKGIRERLFCESCEQHFNEHFEKPFFAQWTPPPLPDPWIGDGTCHLAVDYSTVKLFHLSVLFRAGVSSLPHYAQVVLGPHEDELRQLLLDPDPGRHFQYPICGQAVVHHTTNQLIRAITQPCVYNIDSHRYYAIMYGGVEWWIKVSRHRHKPLEALFLRPDGTLPLSAIPWNEIPVIQRAAAALRGQRS